MLWRATLIIAICTVMAGLSAVQAYAFNTPAKNKGLFITPVREYLDVAAGKRAEGTLTVANITEKAANIDLSVEQFTVEDFSYDYMFTPSKKDWVKLGTTQLSLEPGKSQKISYTLDVPKGATPGGYYFTIFATETIEGNGRKVRVGEALYVTVKGELRRTSHIQKAVVQSVAFGGDIPFQLDIKNTGNTHFFMYVSGSIKGIGTEVKGQENAHILLPGTVRTVKGMIPSPLWPGVYDVTYGYRVDDGQTTTQTKHLVYVPPWSLAVTAGLLLAVLTLWKRRQRLTRKPTDS